MLFMLAQAIDAARCENAIWEGDTHDETLRTYGTADRGTGSAGSKGSPAHASVFLTEHRLAAVKALGRMRASCIKEHHVRCVSGSAAISSFCEISRIFPNSAGMCRFGQEKSPLPRVCRVCPWLYSGLVRLSFDRGLRTHWDMFGVVSESAPCTPGAHLDAFRC